MRGPWLLLETFISMSSFQDLILFLYFIENGFWRADAEPLHLFEILDILSI